MFTCGFRRFRIFYRLINRVYVAVILHVSDDIGGVGTPLLEIAAYLLLLMRLRQASVALSWAVDVLSGLTSEDSIQSVVEKVLLEAK